MLLDALGHSYHAGPLIDRSVFEDVATAHWAADDSAQYDARFLRLTRSVPRPGGRASALSGKNHRRSSPLIAEK